MKWIPVRVKKTRQNKRLELGFVTTELYDSRPIPVESADAKEEPRNG
jgi:hypothetical protein